MKKFFYLFFIFLIIYCICAKMPISNALSQYGSRGDEVKQIQTKLKQWGYYNGSIDGIYGSRNI